MSDIYIEVDGSHKPLQSCTVEWSLKTRATADVWLGDNGGSFAVGNGQRVIIGNSDDVLFGGTIDETTPTWLPGTAIRRWHTRCVSFEQLAARKHVTGNYTTDPAGLIFFAVISAYLAADGVTLHPDVDTSGTPIVGPFQWDSAPVEQVLDDIALASGLYWDFTHDQKARLFGRTAYPAPWNITETSPEVRKRGALEVRYDRQKVANRVIVKIGQYIGSDLISQTFLELLGDHKYGTTYSIGATPSITIEGVAQTVGILGTDTGKDWYWQVGSNTLTQDDSLPELTTETILVEYYVLSSTTLIVEDTANQLARALTEGTSGIYEVVIEANSPTTRWDAQRIGEAYLAAHKDDAVVMTINTRRNDLRIGQVIHANLPYLGIDADMLIESVTLTAGKDQEDNYEASCSSGALLETWQQAFSGGGGSGFVGGGLTIQSSSTSNSGRISYAA